MQDSMEKKANLLDVDRNSHHHPQPMPMQARRPHPPTRQQPPEVERRTFREWIDFIQKHKPQSNALALGIFVILNGGVQFASGIFNHHLVKEREDEIELSAEISSWFAAAIVGFLLSAGIVTRHSKVAIYIVALAMSSTSWAVLLINPKNYIFSIVSRCIGGLAYGITFPTVLIHAAEVSVNSLRGIHVALVQFVFVVGQFIGALYATALHADPDHYNHERNIDLSTVQRLVLIGILVFGLLVGIVYHRESPVYLLRKNKEEKATNLMLRLRSESQMTEEVYRDIDDYKRIIHESNIASGLDICGSSIFLIVLLKLASVAAFNLTLNVSILKTLSHEFTSGDGKFDKSALILILTKFGSLLITLNFMNFKRMFVFKVSCMLSTVALFGIFTVDLLELGDYMVIVFAIILQASSASISGIADILQVEAFDLRSKPLAIAIISSVEFLFHIGSIKMFFFVDDFMTPVLVMSGVGGFLMLIATAIAIKTPDTSDLSLIHARLKLY